MKDFAAFIMTYQRNATLEATIKVMLAQSVSPQKILIVDNDPSEGAKIVADKFSNLHVAYHPVGYNSGPAGAAKIGLEILSNEGYEWVAWIDDDDPPVFDNTFELLLKLAKSNSRCGCVGVVGQKFNQKKGLMIRVSDAELEGSGTMEVDNIAGGMSKIVNAKAVREHNIFPDPQLFYGFEELDFDISLKRSGYILLIDKEVYKKHRIYYNRSGVNIQRGQKKPISRLWREYYSTRNVLKILYKSRLYQALFFSLFRFIIKMFLGFRYGIVYGMKNIIYIGKAILHFFLNKKGSIKTS